MFLGFRRYSSGAILLDEAGPGGGSLEVSWSLLVGENSDIIWVKIEDTASGTLKARLSLENPKLAKSLLALLIEHRRLSESEALASSFSVDCSVDASIDALRAVTIVGRFTNVPIVAGRFSSALTIFGSFVRVFILAFSASKFAVILGRALNSGFYPSIMALAARACCLQRHNMCIYNKCSYWSVELPHR